MTAVRPRHIFISCGEASGDRYGADLVSALRALDPDLRISAVGSRRLESAGVEIVHDADALGVMGFTAVARAMPEILRARRRVGRFLVREKVDLAVPLDFPGFNGWMAGRAKALGIPVFWLIAPQVWAWGGWRIPGLRRRIDRLGVILPFEREFFAARGFDVFAMGHPLNDVYGGDFPYQDSRRRREETFQQRQGALTVGLLPGSRRQELKRLLPVLKVAGQALAGHLRDRPLHVVASVAPGLDKGLLAEGLGSEIPLSELPLPELLPTLDLALVCSGTASLEAALAGVPHEIVYKTGRLDYFLARRMVRVPHIGLANLILDEPLVLEHVQDQVAPLPLVRSLLRWVARPERRHEFYAGCDRLRERCGPGGVWERTAAAILTFLDRDTDGPGAGAET